MSFGICLWVYAAIVAFNFPQCEHVYTAIEQPVIKVEKGSNFISGVYFAPPTSKHEGPALICVKCFHKTKQVLDYGESDCISSGLTLEALRLCCDTVNATRLSLGDMFLKADSIRWVK